MLDIYKISDQALRARLMAWPQGQRMGWLTDFDDVLPAGTLAYIGLESAASQVRSYAALTVPDLAQTPGYAAALCRVLHPPLAAGKASKLAVVTMRRQELACGTAGQRRHLIADESALLCRIGSPTVMAAQLDRLATIIADPSLTIQVAPPNRAREVLTSSFTVLSFAEPDAADVACRGEVHNATGLTKRNRDVAALAANFTALSHSALTPEASANLIRHLARTERNRS